jgi:predicted permease
LKDVSRVHRVYVARLNRGLQTTQSVSTIGDYLDLMRGTTSFDTMAAWTTQRRAVGNGTSTRELLVTGANAAYFDLFDARPVLGRLFTNAEDRLPTGSPVAVLGYTFWQVAYGGNRDVLGETLRIGATMFTIVGVAPKDFSGIDDDAMPAMYVPFAAFVWDSRPGDHTQDYHWHFLTVVARRKPEVTIAAATADLTAALNSNWVKSGRSEVDRAAERPRAVLGGVKPERGSLARVTIWVSAVAAIVLLIACANVANLLLARAVTREPEIAMRRALGASFGRLMRQLFIESALLAGAGSVGAVVVAQGVSAIVSARVLSADAPQRGLADARTVAIILLTTVAAALAISLVPVLHVHRMNLTGRLGSAGRYTDGRTLRTRALLLTTQLSLSVVLLIGAGLFVRSFQNAGDLRLGYDVDPIVVVSEHRRGDQRSPGAEWNGVETRLTEAAARLPGVLAASPAASVPFWGFEGRSLSTETRGVDEIDSLGNFILQAGTPEYFTTTGTRIVRGRGFAITDRANGPPVLVVSQAMGRILWPGQDALGQCLYVHERTDRGPCRTVVGIAEDAHIQTLDASDEFVYYLPLAQYPEDDPTGTLLVRVAGDASDFTETVRKRLQPLMPGNGYVTVVPLSRMLAVPLRSWRLGATMFVVFGVLALVVASVGLYSVVAYGIAQRRREIAIRLALGSSETRVLTLVVQGTLVPVLASVVIGSAIALASAKWAAPLLFRVSPTDPSVYAGVAGVLVVIALLAASVPAFAAAHRMDPNLVLRTD